MSVSSEEDLADAMTCGSAGEAGSTFAEKGGLVMNILLGHEGAVHGFEHGPGEGPGGLGGERLSEVQEGCPGPELSLSSSAVWWAWVDGAVSGSGR